MTLTVIVIPKALPPLTPLTVDPYLFLTRQVEAVDRRAG